MRLKNLFHILLFVCAIPHLNAVEVANTSPKVAVVGAGLAGLTAAYRLQQNGIDVELFEARPRVGGRIFSINVNGYSAELGGQNIYDGDDAENMRRLIDEFNLELLENTLHLNHLYFDGNQLVDTNKPLQDKNFDPIELQNTLANLQQKSATMQEVLKGVFNENDLLYKVKSTRLAAYEGGTIDKLSSIYTETLYHMLLGGVSAAHQSQGVETSVKLLRIREGNSKLPVALANALCERLHLNKILKSLSKKEDGSYLLAFADNSQFKADIVILAIPCSVYEDIDFKSGVIPQDRLEKIRNVRYGTNAKILIPFSHLPEEKSLFVNDSMVSFFDFEMQLFTLYCTGQSSQFTQETLLKTYQVGRSMMEVGYQADCPPLQIPVFAKDQLFCNYCGPVGYSWPNDPFVKGSYSYIAPGQEKILTAMALVDGELVKTLFAPIDQTLYFAGEHSTILTDIPGTMEAACESGERAARMLLNTRSLVSGM